VIINDVIESTSKWFSLVRSQATIRLNEEQSSAAFASRHQAQLAQQSSFISSIGSTTGTFSINKVSGPSFASFQFPDSIIQFQFTF
jgi:hypothetical protein